jgi:toxin secretion/phage lysis holin
LKQEVLTVIGVVGSLIASALGGWDTGLQTLIIFMSVDYISGLVVAAVFKKSGKSETGALESHAGWKGLFKKGMQLLFALIGHQLDVIIGTDFVRNAVIIAFTTNELISIVENAGLMGIPVPTVISKAIDILNKKGNDGGNS